MCILIPGKKIKANCHSEWLSKKGKQTACAHNQVSLKKWNVPPHTLKPYFFPDDAIKGTQESEL